MIFQQGLKLKTGHVGRVDIDSAELVVGANCFFFFSQNVLHVTQRYGRSCSKHRKLNKLISGQNVNCSSKNYI